MCTAEKPAVVCLLVHTTFHKTNNWKCEKERDAPASILPTQQIKILIGSVKGREMHLHQSNKFKF